MKDTESIRFIDLFAGIGGTRLGFENACKELGFKSKCVFTSEIKEHAVRAYKANFGDEEIFGDITKIDANEIPDFDYLLAGFPCQPFSSAGSRKGFLDTRGTLFFEIERILKEKNPKGFLLENVEGLVNHDKVDKSKKLGRTLETILLSLENLGYKTTWKVLDASKHGVPQQRKRIYIIGRKGTTPSLENIPLIRTSLSDVLENGLATKQSKLINKLLSHYSLNELMGKSVKDKRGGKNNIHSWDIELKGPTTQEQRILLNKLLTERRKKQWGISKGITWMDGMPLTITEIETFWNPADLFSNQSNKNSTHLKEILDDLVDKGYLHFEHPKDVVETVDENGNIHKKREFRTDLPKGYNIVAGKLSFEVSKVLDPKGVAPTLVATDVSRLYVVDNEGLRKLTDRECLRLFGFPDSYKMDLSEGHAFDLLGNTVVVPIIQIVANRLLNTN